MRKILIILLCVVLSSCASPAYLKRKAEFRPAGWKKVVVLPFTGDRRFTEESTDVFKRKLNEQTEFEIVEVSKIEGIKDELLLRESYPGDYTVSEAQKIARMVDAEAVFLGKVSLSYAGLNVRGSVNAKLVDTKSGEVIAESSKPVGLLFELNERRAVLKTTEQVAEEMLGVLKDLASK